LAPLRDVEPSVGANGGSLALSRSESNRTLRGPEMRQLAVVIAALGLLPAPANAQALDAPTFGAIPWGAPAHDVIEAATAAGLQMVAKDADGDYQFEGLLFGSPARVYAFMSPASGLVKVQVRLATPGDEVRRKYAEVVESLARQYGRTEGVELYKSPFFKGDGRESRAVRLGKGLLYSTWGDDGQPGQAALVVRATKSVVGLDYESYDWSVEVARRTKKADPVL